MTKKKYTKSQRRHIRNEKASIRREILDTKKQDEAIEKLLAKVSGKLHQHPKPKADSKAKKIVAKKTTKETKPAKEVTKTEKKEAPKAKPKEAKAKK